MRSVLIVLATLAAVSAISATAARADDISMFGQGLLSCATWTQKRNAEMTETGKVERAGEEAWIAGFLSGAGSYATGKNPLAHAEFQDVLDYVDAYCRSHPDKPMVRAGMSFISCH